jgi:hypothetical protein
VRRSGTASGVAPPSRRPSAGSRAPGVASGCRARRARPRPRHACADRGHTHGRGGRPSPRRGVTEHDGPGSASIHSRAGSVELSTLRSGFRTMTPGAVLWAAVAATRAVIHAEAPGPDCGRRSPAARGRRLRRSDRHRRVMPRSIPSIRARRRRRTQRGRRSHRPQHQRSKPITPEGRRSLPATPTHGRESTRRAGPETRGIGLLEFHQIDPAVEAGRAAGRAVVELLDARAGRG